jgi:hypothetical protein
MAKSLKMFRGDAKSITVNIPLDQWTPGGSLFFAAKKVIDNDLVDSSAKMKKTINDSNIVDTTSVNKVYLLPLSNTDTNVDPGEYIGEFQFVNSLGQATTFAQFTIEVLGDVNRRTT